MATSERNVHKFMGQKLYKYDVKLSKRAQEVAGMPLINFNLTPGPASLTTTITKEPLKRTFSACTHHGEFYWVKMGVIGPQRVL